MDNLQTYINYKYYIKYFKYFKIRPKIFLWCKVNREDKEQLIL